MTAYEVYWFDKNKTYEVHFLGILPERRKNLLRITKESVLNWARKVLGDYSDAKNIYFIQVEV